MAMGALLLADLAIRATDLNVMYTDAGMFPRGLIRHHYTSRWYWSFHLANGSLPYQAALFGIATVFAVALLLGLKTRFAVIASWLMLVSVQHRVPPVLSGADILFRVLLFWAMFLPVERAWSLDRWLAQRRHGTTIHGGAENILSVASAAILLQIALVYLFSAIFKSNTIWIRGEAIAGILQHDFYASRLSANLLQFRGLLKAGTWGTLFLEWAAPVFLFVPKHTASFRIWLVTALGGMHLCIGLFLMVGLFSAVSLTGLILFLPAEFWDRLLALFSPNRKSVQLNCHLAPNHSVAKARTPLTRLAEDVCLLLLIYVIALNINTLSGRPLAWLAPENWKPLTMGCALGQRWGCSNRFHQRTVGTWPRRS
jgi:hypothetical protein